MALPKNLGELKESGYQIRSVKDEMRANLVRKLRAGERLFPGILGYYETVVPQITNAVLARHNLILLGLRGQAKSRIIRQLTDLLDESIPVIAGSEINDDPFHPISAYGRQMIELHGDSTPILWVERDARFVEKLATPDVTIADIIGDVDPIKAAKGGHLLSDELTIHYGLLRARTAASSPSTSCRIWPARFRSASSTSCRRATCRLRATPCACPST